MVNKILSYIFDEEDSYDKNLIKLLNLRYFLIFVCNLLILMSFMMIITEIFNLETDNIVIRIILISLLAASFMIPTFLLTILKKIDYKPMAMQWVAFILGGPLFLLFLIIKETNDLVNTEIEGYFYFGLFAYLYIFISSLIANIRIGLEIKKRKSLK